MGTHGRPEPHRQQQDLPRLPPTRPLAPHRCPKHRPTAHLPLKALGCFPEPVDLVRALWPAGQLLHSPAAASSVLSHHPLQNLQANLRLWQRIPRDWHQARREWTVGPIGTSSADHPLRLHWSCSSRAGPPPYRRKPCVPSAWAHVPPQASRQAAEPNLSCQACFAQVVKTRVGNTGPRKCLPKQNL